MPSPTIKQINKIYINGQFVTPHGSEVMDLISPVTEQVVSQVRLADETDTQQAIAAAKAAYVSFSQTSKAQRIQYLQQLHDAVLARADELEAVMMAEYGGTRGMVKGTVARASMSFLQGIKLLQEYDFVRYIGQAKVVMEPLGVVGLITPWNANYGFICNKMASALAAGSTVVIKPSELSAVQTQIITECLHDAGLPPGVFNIVTGRGEVVGAEITRHPDIAKISFTGSTLVGKAIARGAVDTMKRVTLELGGKSPNVILEDADLEKAIPLALMIGTFNNGQACLAGTRLLVPHSRLEEVKKHITSSIGQLTVGDPAQSDVFIGPLVTEKQYQRVQNYIRQGIAEGAELLCGGEGRPAGLESGYFVKPTVFVNVTPEMTISREEIFGPVISVLTYNSIEEAIAMANDTVYGLHGYVSGNDIEKTRYVASKIVAGRVFINGMYDVPDAPFGGFKQSGIGRELGTFGLEAYLEPKSIVDDQPVNTSHA